MKAFSIVDERHLGLLEVMLNGPLAQDWNVIRQCLRCMVQGKIIDCGSGEDDRPYIRDNGDPKYRSTEDAVIEVWTVAKSHYDGDIVAAARYLSHTPEAIKAQIEWAEYYDTKARAKEERRNGSTK